MAPANRSCPAFATAPSIASARRYLTLTLTAQNGTAALQPALDAKARELYEAILVQRPKDIVESSEPACEAFDVIPDRQGSNPVHHQVQLFARMAHTATLTVSIPQSEVVTLSQAILQNKASPERSEFRTIAELPETWAQFDAFYGLERAPTTC